MSRWRRGRAPASWLERAVAHRRYFAVQSQSYPHIRAPFLEGIELVHQWAFFSGLRSPLYWAARLYCELDDTMERNELDGSSGWGAFRNDLTTWLSWRVMSAHVPRRPDGRDRLDHVARCTARHLEALGGAFAEVAAPLCSRWEQALVSRDAAGLGRVLSEARAERSFTLAGSGGVLSLMESSARTVEGAPLRITAPIRPSATTRSGVQIAAGSGLRFEVMLPDGEARAEYLASVERRTIGRAASNDLCIDHRAVGELHAEVVVHDGCLALVDPGSEYGTRVGEEEVTTAPFLLEDGDLVQIGSILLEIGCADSAAGE